MNIVCREFFETFVIVFINGIRAILNPKLGVKM